jgi:hypothetical protein
MMRLRLEPVSYANCLAYTFICYDGAPAPARKMIPYCLAKPNPLVARYEDNTKEIRSILRPFILRLFLGP